eukprot:Blabericola_migrator_1__298@NODE_1078_length_5517_cov_162_706606_g738_i0_p4_GENE_NODE_1078_length_5517_cov_162_706606_g738_i0NODE_1078_length_5517_cov_162_706606_g738_i0_p4_ORF_typecomplete_len132_score17_14GxGYxYP_N/PF16216_5/0_23_NODE_1078_length_5517_cov_162_706606_g738_i040864481
MQRKGMQRNELECIQCSVAAQVDIDFSYINISGGALAAGSSGIETTISLSLDLVVVDVVECVLVVVVVSPDMPSSSEVALMLCGVDVFVSGKSFACGLAHKAWKRWSRFSEHTSILPCDSARTTKHPDIVE